MNTLEILSFSLAVALGVAFTMNGVDWIAVARRSASRRPFLEWPISPVVNQWAAAAAGATSCAALLVLVGEVRLSVFPVIAVPQAIALQVYSILHRHRRVRVER